MQNFQQQFCSIERVKFRQLCRSLLLLTSSGNSRRPRDSPLHPTFSILQLYKAINEKHPWRFVSKLLLNEAAKTQTRMPFLSPTTKVYLCGLAFWFVQSPLRYGPERKGLKSEYFQWKKTFCSTFTEFQLKWFCQFTLSGRAKLSMASCLYYNCTM